MPSENPRYDECDFVLVKPENAIGQVIGVTDDAADFDEQRDLFCVMPFAGGHDEYWYEYELVPYEATIQGKLGLYFVERYEYNDGRYKVDNRQQNVLNIDLQTSYNGDITTITVDTGVTNSGFSTKFTKDNTYFSYPSPYMSTREDLDLRIKLAQTFSSQEWIERIKGIKRLTITLEYTINVNGGINVEVRVFEDGKAWHTEMLGDNHIFVMPAIDIDIAKNATDYIKSKLAIEHAESLLTSIIKAVKQNNI